MYYILLGLIQGLTEFLPISSSGHLVIAQYLLGIKIPGVGFEIFVHFGSLIAVLLLYRKEIKNLFFAFFRTLRYIHRPVHFINLLNRDSQAKFFWLVVISTIPGGLAGFFLNDFFENIFGNPLFISIMFLITGTCLYFTDRYLKGGSKNIAKMNAIDALLVGISQAFAILPGISRSGFTIMMGLYRNMERDLAAKYSFILSIPMILGASLYKLSEIIQLEIHFYELVLSGFAAFISGYLAMNIFIKMLVKYKLRYFSFYLWLMGAFLILIRIT